MFDSNSPGNVFFLDRGVFLYNQLVKHMKERYLTTYEELSSPLMFRSDLWKTSGHYDHYRENMFHVETRSAEEVGVKSHKITTCFSCIHKYSFSSTCEFKQKCNFTLQEIYLKPMNCPSHCLVFNSRVRSYRDLPLRYAEFSPIHRQENSGALGGLTRLNMFHQVCEEK